VTAMVVWSQIGIVGYLLGPLLGGALAQTAGYEALGLIPAAAGGVLLTTAMRTAQSTDAPGPDMRSPGD
jgi:MFS family permease